MSISTNDFLKLVHAKQRQFKFTRHALNRAEKRSMQPEICREEILTKEPDSVQEQGSEMAEERQFNLYYKQDYDKYHRYVVALNNSIRVITMMRISRNLQSRWTQWRM